MPEALLWRWQNARLSAQNIDDFLTRFWNTAKAILAQVAMLEMAKRPQYRSDDRIKITPLYIDFRLNWKPAGVCTGEEVRTGEAVLFERAG